MGLVKEFIQFLWHRKLWWLSPIIVILLGLGLLILFTGNPMTPFIYIIF